MRHKDRVQLGEGIVSRMFRAVAFSYTLEEADTVLIAVCTDAIVIQIVSYESLFKSPNGRK